MQQRPDGTAADGAGAVGAVPQPTLPAPAVPRPMPQKPAFPNYLDGVNYYCQVRGVRSCALVCTVCMWSSGDGPAARRDERGGTAGAGPHAAAACPALRGALGVHLNNRGRLARACTRF